MSISTIATNNGREKAGELGDIVDSYKEQFTLMFSNLTNHERSTVMYEGTKIISDDIRRLFELINFTLLLGTVSFFGICGNVINLVVFLKQGFNDSVNISLFSLAISDIGCLVTMLWQSICYNRWFVKSPLLPFYSLEVQYLTGGWPHICFARITTWITLFITIERCLCVTMPLKVKQIVTHRRTVVVLVAIYVIMIGSISPIYYTTKLGKRFFPELNRTLVGLVYTSDREKVDSVSFAVNNVFVQLLSFTGIIVFTIILVVTLKNKTKWRDSNVQVKRNQQDSSASSSASLKDRRVVKMITFISTVFIICFFPITVIFVGMVIVPDFNIGARYQNLQYFLCSFTFVMEGISSSSNILIYYNMSSKYREVFRSFLHRRSAAHVQK